LKLLWAKNQLQDTKQKASKTIHVEESKEEVKSVGLFAAYTSADENSD